MIEFDKKIVLDNIYYLAKKHNIKIGDLEAAANVSAGYFSRINKEDNKTVPGIDVIAVAAEKLGISIDSLTFIKFNELSSTEEYIISFLDRVLKLTRSGNRYWSKESLKKIDALIKDNDNNNRTPGHPLFKYVMVPEISYTGTYDYNEAAIYNSLFRPEEDVILYDDVYTFCLDGNSTLYLTKVIVKPDENSTATFLEYEVYIVKKNGNKTEVHSVCHSIYNEVLAFDFTLEILFNTAKESAKSPRINKTVVDIIDNFMLFNDPDLPF